MLCCFFIEKNTSIYFLQMQGIGKNKLMKFLYLLNHFPLALANLDIKEFDSLFLFLSFSFFLIDVCLDLVVQ